MKTPVNDSRINVYRQQSDWSTGRSLFVLLACTSVLPFLFLFSFLVAFCLTLIVAGFIFKIDNIKTGLFLVCLFIPLAVFYSDSAYILLSDIVAQMIFFGFTLFIVFSFMEPVLSQRHGHRFSKNKPTR
jgi:4-amino-4-deoxy-L-arabinose transferase-like glycosyltransferase